ncbi:TniQ family protein [Rhodoferax sediminis]|uniref:TniQ domain-containing protein n=1 Tax=Rhodoferax sediminis TaxID=2509614 RepID=A0A515D7J2_9BURK|nr:TniQ family protein [Rhodoferax sediminis]QDL36382.1 hypothetical protein EUB48_02990 [Rhodoferax sediminis]
MSTTEQALFGCPAPFLDEAPVSWICRLALSQASTPEEITKLLGLGGKRDLDVKFSRLSMDWVSDLCGLDRGCFAASHAVLTSYDRVYRQAPEMLLSMEGVPRFRYCPVCLGGQLTAYFPVQWKFATWSYCPAHGCFMENHCERCLAPLVLPRDLGEIVANNREYLSLRNCGRCGNDMSKREPCLVAEFIPMLADWEQMLMTNGRASISAFYHGYLTIKGWRGKRNIKEVLKLRDKGALHFHGYRLDADVVRRRQQTPRAVNTFRSISHPMVRTDL